MSIMPFRGTCFHCGHDHNEILFHTLPTPQVTDEMVTRFLSWELPKDFYPDGGIAFDRNEPWPTGTNLFTAQQARQMLEFVFTGGKP